MAEVECLNREKEKVEVTVAETEEGELLLWVGDEAVEIADFTSRSSAHGDTELFITIKGRTVSTELSASSGLQR